MFLILARSIENKFEVTILSGLNEFSVKFYGPTGSMLRVSTVLTLCVVSIGITIIDPTTTSN
jgi:hypothetical protein